MDTTPLRPEISQVMHPWLESGVLEDSLERLRPAFAGVAAVMIDLFQARYKDIPEEAISVYAIGGLLVGNETQSVTFIAYHPSAYRDAKIPLLGGHVGLEIEPFKKMTLLDGNVATAHSQTYLQIQSHVAGVKIAGPVIDWLQPLPEDSYEVARILGEGPWLGLVNDPAAIEGLSSGDIAEQVHGLLTLLMIPVIAKGQQYSPNFTKQVRLIAGQTEELAPLALTLEKALEGVEPIDEDELTQFHDLLKLACVDIAQIMGSHNA